MGAFYSFNEVRILMVNATCLLYFLLIDFNTLCILLPDDE